MASVPEYTIRPMVREEIPQVLQLWRETGLEEGTHSLDTWFEHDPEGFYVAVQEDGTVLGACAGVLQNDDLAFIGLYVVKAAYQKRGIGRKIWNAVMERVGDRNVGVNPVPDQLENYRDRSNFPIQTDWFTVVGFAPGIDPSRLDADVPGVHIRPLTRSDPDLVERVARYDADVCGFDRGDLVGLLADQEESSTLVATRVDDGLVCGYGNVRMSIKGNAIVGPLYADGPRVAEGILAEMVRAFPTAESEGVMFMLIDCNREAMELAEKVDFARKSVIARLYRKEDVKVKYEKVFSQHNLNFSIF